MKWCLLFICFYTHSIAQKNIFEISKKGTLLELEACVKINENIINEVDKNGHSPLILATYFGNSNVFHYLVDNVKNINQVSKNGSALMAAVIKENVEYVSLILNKKPNINIQDSNGQTALIMAINTKNIEIIKLLLLSKPDLKIKDIYYKDALDYALMSNKQEIIKLLNY